MHHCLRDLGPHLHLRPGLRTPDGHQHGGDVIEQGGVAAGGQLLGAGPSSPVHRTRLPPTPHFFGDEGHERGEQPQLDAQRELQGGLCRRGRRIIFGTVGAFLDQLQVVIAERPEELLRHLERIGVLELVQRMGCPLDDIAQFCQHRQVVGLADGIWADGQVLVEHELGRVQDLHREPASDLHLGLVER